MPGFVRTLAHRARVTRVALTTIAAVTAASLCNVVALHLMDLADGLRSAHQIEDDEDLLLEDLVVEDLPEVTHVGDGQPLRSLTVHSNLESGKPSRVVVFLPRPRSAADALAAAKAAHPAGKGRTLEPLA